MRVLAIILTGAIVGAELALLLYIAYDTSAAGLTQHFVFRSIVSGTYLAAAAGAVVGGLLAAVDAAVRRRRRR